ncbi:MAG: gfo/Idh/MocA family oxidoreductase, partial [Planctomycetota bacterium]
MIGLVPSAIAISAASRVLGSQDSITKPRIKIGQIGVGHAHASKLSVYRASSDYEVVGIAEPDEGLRKAAENAAPYKGLKWLT